MTTHTRFQSITAALAVAVALLVGAATASAAPIPGVDWDPRTTPTPNSGWNGIAYGAGRWVAVGGRDILGAVTTSADGDTWTQVSGVPAGGWTDVHYANGLFVAVADYSNNQVMTSSDGTTWTVRANSPSGNPTSSTGLSQSDAYFQGVTYGAGRWVVANRTTTQVNNQTVTGMLTSTDGLTWNVNAVHPTSSNKTNQSDLTFGNGTFVAVYADNGLQAVKTSTDGLSWTDRQTPNNTPGTWEDVAFGNGTFVAVGNSGAVMTSTDNGATWTLQTAASNRNWMSVAYGSGLFVAVASSGTGNRVMTSPDGTTWTPQTSAADNAWQNVAWANGRFVAVANSGTDRAMTSGDVVFDLTVAAKGDGTGTVTSTPAGIDCGSTCTASFANGTSVTLTATPSAGNSFTGWSDGCSGTATTCTVTISAATTVTATFTKDASAPATGTTPAAKATAPLTIARASGNASIITTTVKATTPGRAVMTGTVGGKAAFRPGTHVFTKPSTATIRAALNDRVRALLRTRDVRVKITIRFTAADGRTTTSTRTVLLKKIKVRPEPVTG